MMGKKIAVVVGLLGLVLFFASGYLFAPPDRVLIQQSLNRAVDAARAGQPSPVLDKLSAKFSYGGEWTNRGEIAKVIRQARPEISVLKTDPVVAGNTATIVSPVSLRVNYMGIGVDSTLPEVTIRFEKETGTKWILVPEPRWRITAVEAEALPDY